MRPNILDGRQAADLDLLLIVGQRLLGERKGFLRHSHILIGKHQVPVEVFDLIYRSDDLKPESHVSDFAVVLGDPDQPIIGQEPEAL